MPPSETAANINPRRQPDLYWKELQQLKAATICIRLYRNQLANWVRGIDWIKALASSGGIAGWAVWNNYPFFWSGIIAAAQFLDVMRGVFHFTKQHRAASDLTVALELLYIDAEDEWEAIYLGNISNEMISQRRTKLRKLQLEAERKHFPEGFAPSQKLIDLAAKKAEDYFLQTHTELMVP